MKNLFIAIFIVTFFTGFSQSIVEEHGQLKVEGTHIVDKNGEPIQLKGMSFFWSQWMGQFYTKSTVKWLKKDWKCTVLRPAMGVEKGGYLTNPKEEQFKVETVVKACIKLGIYVVIDYHAHEAHKNTQAAKIFFADMARKYGDQPNVIYELYNEPLGDNGWNTEIKPYAEAVIDTIRHYDPDNIIVVGTPRWSQLVDTAATYPIERENIAYTLHFYAASHKQELRDKAQTAIDKGICLFVTEFGTCPASGNGKFDEQETRTWLEFLDKHKISWCNWSIADKAETASVLKPGADGEGYWLNSELTESGAFIRSQIRKK